VIRIDDRSRAGNGDASGSRVSPTSGKAHCCAVQSGATLLTNPTSPIIYVLQDGDNFFFETQIEFCRNAKRNEPGMNCFYAPYSKCTVKDAAASVGKL
jgi:hypothetical protein